MRYIFIGDVHSAYDDLSVLVDYLDAPATKFIFLGDYIDGQPVQHYKFGDQARSLEPLKVLDLIMDRVDQHGDVALLGNHDDFWLGTAANNYEIFRNWQLNGGARTWTQMGLHGNRLRQLKPQLTAAPYQRYTQFLAHLPLTWETEKLFAVHAGINWQRSMNAQRREDLLWIRDDYLYEAPMPSLTDVMTGKVDHLPGFHRNTLGKIMVTGHTPTQTILDHTVFLTMQHDDHDLPRYLIDAGSRSGCYNAGITAAVFAESGALLSTHTVVNQQIYDNARMIK